MILNFILIYLLFGDKSLREETYPQFRKNSTLKYSPNIPNQLIYSTAIKLNNSSIRFNNSKSSAFLLRVLLTVWKAPITVQFFIWIGFNWIDTGQRHLHSGSGGDPTPRRLAHTERRYPASAMSEFNSHPLELIGLQCVQAWNRTDH